MYVKGYVMEDIARVSARHGFAVLSYEALPEIDGEAYVMRHEASGARLLYLKNDDSNKAFSISFKTPAADDTGVFHILEHSVLCGSRKFPVKEPFVNLLKSSMQTFLNAMTFPDKTMYPVASTSEQDLMNLMDVYLDAVFYPAIYEKETIFQQEGWHLELAGGAPGTSAEGVEGEGASAEGAEGKAEGESAEGEAEARERDGEAACASASGASGRPTLVYNGVVYNEMKGACSDPDSVLYDTLSSALFPDTTYRFVSGGEPRSIPSLTYEAFLDTHRRHYRPDNSYLMLYGDLNLDAFLAFIDEQYLSDLAAQSWPELNVNPLVRQEPVRVEGVVRPMVTSPENASRALGFVVGDARDRERMIATDILLDAIMGSNEAPMKRALLDAGIAADASAFLADAVLQPFAVIQLKGTREGARERFAAIVEEQARLLAEGALDLGLVEAALSHAEFVMREHNFGCADGVVHAMTSMAGWLYDEELPTAYLRYEDVFAHLRAQLANGYFERLIAELFLENDHRAEVELRAVADEPGVSEADRLAALAETLSPDDVERIARNVDALRRVQEAPDDPKDVAKLPQLGVEDIAQMPHEGAFRLEENAPLPCVRHDVATHGIVYTYRYFDLACLSFDELRFATVLAMVLGKLSTAHHSAAEIDTLVQSKLGDLSFFVDVDEKAELRDDFEVKFVVGASALSENVEHTVSLVNEILLETDFSDADKILDVLMQKRVAIEQSFISAGHSVALSRVSSYCLPASVVREQLGGIDFYLFLRDLTDNWDARADALGTTLAALAERLFGDAGTVVSFTGTDEDMQRFWEAGVLLGRAAEHPRVLEVPAPRARNEAFVVASDVSYAAMGFDRRLLGEPYSGVWQVAARVLSYDYLWNEVRVKGGAYGAGFQAQRSGLTRFYSYRDPHVDATIRRFSEAGAWLSAFDPTDAEMVGYVVSTAASFDAPLKPRNLVRRQDGMFFTGYTPRDRERTRAQIVSATVRDVRALGDAVRRVAAERLVCVVGNRAAIGQASEGFEVINLMGE